jgi:hypothetical protein
MRDLDTIDSELRLLVAVRPVCRELDGTVGSTRLIDTLLDERSSLRANVSPGVSWRTRVADRT